MEYLMAEWEEFERDSGSLETVMECERRLRRLRQTQQAQSAQSAQPAQVAGNDMGSVAGGRPATLRESRLCCLAVAVLPVKFHEHFYKGIHIPGNAGNGIVNSLL